ncbi:lysophospholipid acyltransferase family protein [Roseomonas sp. BN140053]|uniref:lysophospholipid acyltransferase family protein n=1 Tax=Roseomonas sp. BN140053 TaxID=3391898 RepID=UPI0039E9503E
MTRPRRRGPLSRGVKAVLKSAPLARLLGHYLDLCRRTARWELLGTEPLHALARGEAGFVLAFWHECLPVMPLAWDTFWRSVDPAVPRKPGLVLVSRSRDGGMIGAMLDRFGLQPVSGSSSRGGRVAARELLSGLRGGAVAVVVPDGPRGPRRVATPGGLRLAEVVGVPVVPCAASAHPARRLGTWDRMVIPLPFSRCVAVVGPPILPGHGGAEPAARLLEAALNAATLRAEAACRQPRGRPLPVPA